MDKLFTFLHTGDIVNATKIIDSNGDKLNLTESEVNCLFLSFAENIDSFSYPLKTIDFLINRLNASINAVDSNGKTALHHLISNAEIGKVILNKGANILIDDCFGLCPLSLSFSDKSEWLLKEFESSGAVKEL
jgi:ankyrin repeat protein